MKSIREILVSALALMLIAGAVTAALAGTNALTEGRIQAEMEKTENAARLQVIAAEQFDKKTLTDGDNTMVYYEALSSGKTVGYVFTAAVSGKSSGLTVMTAIRNDGTIAGVKITEDNETAGYVDKIVKDGFLERLAGKPAQEIKFGENGVEAVSQATKTSNGVRKAVNQAVAWYQQIQGGVTNE